MEGEDANNFELEGLKRKLAETVPNYVLRFQGLI